jgi:hypothetical protein
MKEIQTQTPAEPEPEMETGIEIKFEKLNMSQGRNNTKIKAVIDPRFQSATKIRPRKETFTISAGKPLFIRFQTPGKESKIRLETNNTTKHSSEPINGIKIQRTKII